MEDEIFDMEQVLGMDDSFCVTDSDVLQILKTWRLTTENEGAVEQDSAVQHKTGLSAKFIDTRTFTRPKKKLMMYPECKFPSIQPEPSPNRGGLQLQIGGPITNPLNGNIMQRSLITEVSPPNSLASSLSYNDCGNSLITSGDFSNIGSFLNNLDDANGGSTNGLRKFTKQSLSSVSEHNRQVSNNLIDDSKDNSILMTDMNGIEEQASGNSTLQNSMEFKSEDCNIPGKNDTFNKDDTFKVLHNVTFDKSGAALLNQTFDQISTNVKYNDTFVQKTSTGSLDSALDKPSGNSTVVLDNVEFNSPTINRGICQLPVQSTPATHLSRVQKFGKSIVVEDLSPITTQPTTLRHKTKLTVEQDDDNKRISLQNFEDVEKSISLLENTQDENGFDVILEDITDLKRSLDTNEKFKQTLQVIKNRHSQANLERQQEELFRKKLDATITLDNKIIDSMNKSMSTSSGSERLLNRRSRLDDTIALTAHTSNTCNSESIESKPALVVDEIKGGVGNLNHKANRDRFKTIRITKRHIEGMVVIDGEEQDDVDTEEVPNNQDYKMVNGSCVYLTTADDQEDIDKENTELFKKPSIPQKIHHSATRARSLSKPKYYSGFYGDRKGSLQLQVVGKASSIDHLDSNRVNSQENMNTMQPGASRVGSIKPNSNLKSPMGAKSKSYHNIAYSSTSINTGNKQLSSVPKYVSRYGQAAMRSAPSIKASGTETLKKFALSNTQLPGKQFIKQNIRASAFCAPVFENNGLTKEISRTYAVTQGPMKSLSLNKPGNIRPSSGYQSYNNINASNRGHDSDIKSGRHSPNSLCSSSASSRGSLHPLENTVKQNTATVISNREGDFNVTVVKQQPPPSRLARPSGLKQPTNFIKRAN